MSQLLFLQILTLVRNFHITLDHGSDFLLNLGELVLVEILKKFLFLILWLFVPKVVLLLILGREVLIQVCLLLSIQIHAYIIKSIVVATPSYVVKGRLFTDILLRLAIVLLYRLESIETILRIIVILVTKQRLLLVLVTILQKQAFLILQVEVLPLYWHAEFVFDSTIRGIL